MLLADSALWDAFSELSAVTEPSELTDTGESEGVFWLAWLAGSLEVLDVFIATAVAALATSSVFVEESEA